MPQDPESSRLTSRPPLADITGALVQPPSRVYIGVDDRLYVRSRNSLASVRLQLAGRLLTAEGVIVPFNFDHIPVNDRTVRILSFRLAEGYLLSAVVFPSVGAPRRGQTFVELGLLRGRGVAADVLDVLARDYVAIEEPLAFPGGPIRSSLEGPGAVLSITGTDPAAGAEITETVPTDARWKLRAFRYTLVTDATAANRQSAVQLSDGSTAFHRGRVHTAQTATQTHAYNHSLQNHFQANVASVNYQNILPDVLLGAGFTIATITGALQGGDDYGAPQLLVEEWIED